jgi:hypothetical protein
VVVEYRLRGLNDRAGGGVPRELQPWSSLFDHLG